MKSYEHKAGLTLIETLIVVAVIVLLISMIIGIAARIDSQGKERLTENTFALLDAALEQFGDYGYMHRDYSVYPEGDERDFYRSLVFPIDCNDFSKGELEDALEDALGATDVSISGVHKQEYSGSEAMYFFLSRVPESRKTLDKIGKKLVTNLDIDDQPMKITIEPGGVNEKEYPLFRVIDPWGRTLRYDYYDEELPPITSTEMENMRESKKAFPIITSAGPDRSFGTTDDITNR